MTTKRLYTISEFLAAEPAMGSEARVYDLIRGRLIPAVRVGRRVFIDPHAWDNFKANGGQALGGGWRRESADQLEARSSG